MIAIALIATCGTLLVSFVPVSDRQPTGLLRVLAACDLLIAVALFAAGPRLPRAGLHAGIAAFIVVMTILSANAHTLAGFMSAARAFQWMAVYASLFLAAREARWHALGITLGCLTAALAGGIHGAVIQAAIMCTTVWVATLLLTALVARLRAQADGDHLTGLLNRNGFAKAANREHALAGRTGAPLTVAVLDLDGFKHVNDEHGHAAGDRVLAELADAWTRTLRPGDVLGRHGGDEFVVMFPATAEGDAAEPLARMRAAHPSDWSAGVVEWRRGETLQACLGRADDRLYEAKAARRATAVSPAPA
ncbi:MAG TPA: GGDEF domain-containing protein [Conexibacter sp.]|nr:GGDEF domain-containing protein [Conexibacter sp.]